MAALIAYIEAGVSIIPILPMHKHEIDAQLPYHGETALHTATRLGRAWAVYHLLEAGACASLTDHKGNPPSFYATHTSIKKMLDNANQKSGRVYTTDL